MRAAVTAVKLSNIFGRDSESTKRSNDSNSQNQNSSSEEVKLEIRSEPKSEGESDVEDEKLLKREVERVNFYQLAFFIPFGRHSTRCKKRFSREISISSKNTFQKM
jgi:hypothetical protein